MKDLLLIIGTIFYFILLVGMTSDWYRQIGSDHWCSTAEHRRIEYFIPARQIGCWLAEEIK